MNFICKSKVLFIGKIPIGNRKAIKIVHISSFQMRKMKVDWNRDSWREVFTAESWKDSMEEFGEKAQFAHKNNVLLRM